MTAEEWLACNDAQQMLHALQNVASERKLRLFAVACCNRIDHIFSPKYQAAVALAERFADAELHETVIAAFRETFAPHECYTHGVEFYIEMAALDVTRLEAVDPENPDRTAAFEAAEHCLVSTNDAESHAAALAGNEADGRATCESLRPI